MKKYFQPFMNLFASGYVVIMHSKITFSIARNVIMIGLLSKRGDVVTTTPRLVLYIPAIWAAKYYLLLSHIPQQIQHRDQYYSRTHAR